MDDWRNAHCPASWMWPARHCGYLPVGFSLTWGNSTALTLLGEQSRSAEGGGCPEDQQEMAW